MEVTTMKVLKRKESLTETITVRVSARVKEDFEELRERAQAAGFDPGATWRKAISNTVRRIRKELEAPKRKSVSQPVEMVVNRFD
jgi:hypothetical protein